MLKELFDASLQEEMEDFFLNEMGEMGIKRRYPSGCMIDPMDANHIYVVIKGRVLQKVYCEDGQELTTWGLGSGTIFGEMDFFDGKKTILSNFIVRDSVISVISRQQVEKLLQEKPHVYQYFIHSIVRKHRLIMLKYTTLRFNDVRGQIADKLLRMAHFRNGEEVKNGVEVRTTSTHESFSKALGISRSTFTSILKEFERAGYITKKRKSFVINDYKGLESQVNRIW